MTIMIGWLYCTHKETDAYKMRPLILTSFRFFAFVCVCVFCVAQPNEYYMQT